MANWHCILPPFPWVLPIPAFLTNVFRASWITGYSSWWYMVIPYTRRRNFKPENYPFSVFPNNMKSAETISHGRGFCALWIIYPLSFVIQTRLSYSGQFLSYREIISVRMFFRAVRRNTIPVRPSENHPVQ